MALLSNINDKFAVDSTGAIQFNGQVGTSGYVLKSNANAAPTWVDPSTVIGGPYLPLTGGTLTGATATAAGISFTVGGTLTGTSATFAGNVTANAFLMSNGSLTPSGFWGTTINAGSGSNADFALLNSATAGIMYNPTGTLNMVFQGDVGIGTNSPNGKLTILEAQAANKGDFDFQQIVYNGGWSTNVDGLAAIQWSDGVGSSNTIGRIGVTYTGSQGEFQIKDLYNGGYAGSGKVFAVRGDGRAYFTGNVGIGTTNPIDKLNVDGGTGDTSTQDSKLALTRTSSTTNVLAGKMVLKHKDTNFGNLVFQVKTTASSAENSAYYTDAITIDGNSANVGIGTTSPEHKLIAIGTIGFGLSYNGGVYVNSTDQNVDENWGLEVQRTANVLDYNTRLKYYPVSGQSRAAGIYDARNARFSLYSDTNNNPNIIIPYGNVGIGATSLSKKLEVVGSFKLGTNAYIEYGGVYPYTITTANTAGIGNLVFSAGLGSAAYESRIDLQGTNTAGVAGITLSTAATPRMVVTADGDVGIGATAPTSKLYLNDPVTNGSSMWTFAPSAQYAYTGHKCWNGIAGTITNNGYYKIGTIEDSRSAIINIKTAAHSNATILVSRGYGQSNLSRFQVLSSTKNANGGYANIIGVRISGGGAVDIQLSWNSGPIIQIEITVYGNGFTIPNTLVASTSSVGGNYPDNVLWSHSLPSDAASAMVAGQLRVTGNIVNPGTWGTTTGSAANMHVDSNGTFFRSTSSLKYKKEVRDYDKGLNEVMQLQPKYYKGKDDGDIQFAGLIAEDVHALGLNEFVQYAEDDTPDALAYPNMIALLTKAIQELEARVKELENK